MSFWKKKPDQLDDGQPEKVQGQATSGAPKSTHPPQVASSSAPTTSREAQKVGSDPTSHTPSAAPLPGPNSKPEDVLTDRFGKTRSALGEGTVIQGKLSFDTPVRIDGKLSGEIFSSKVLIIGPSGRIDAAIEAATLVVLGHVSGTITASERVEFWAGSSVSGNVKTPVLVVQEGCDFTGTSQMLAAQVGLEMAGRLPAGVKPPDQRAAEVKAAEAKAVGAPAKMSAAAAPAASATTDGAKKEARLH